MKLQSWEEMPVKKTEYAIAGIRTYVYCSASDATSQLNSLPVAILFMLHGRGGSHERMERVVDRLLDAQEAQPERMKRELIVVAFVRDLCQDLTAIFSYSRLPGSQKPWRASRRSSWEPGVGSGEYQEAQPPTCVRPALFYLRLIDLLCYDRIDMYAIQSSFNDIRLQPLRLMGSLSRDG